jgi:NAD+ synthase (glutamine-hydrolysing)
MKVALAQINTTVGDLEGNTKKIIKYIKNAEMKKADIVAFPELTITGYPPQDLLYECEFVEKNREMLNNIAKEVKNIIAVIGFVDSCSRSDKTILYNAAAVIDNGKIFAIVHKSLLPTYDVFDEDRYFSPAKEIKPVELTIKGKRISLGIEICEDMWDARYEIKPTRILAKKGAEIILNLSASPFHIGKKFERLRLLRRHAKANRIPILYVNLIGGQDELVFDGQSLAVDKNGMLIAIGKQFEEDLVIVDFDSVKKVEMPRYCREEEMFNALVLGIRDYFTKTGFSKAVIGLSGGIDSALTAVIATEALGKENVLGVSMPSVYSSEPSRRDAEQLAKNLGIQFKIISIQPLFEAYKKILSKDFVGLPEDVTEENIQARIRGNILMALSNKFGYLVLATGNKTELALGYCTLYGDMCGGLGVLSDVSKLDVYKLAKYVNKRYGNVIPKTTIERTPSAELKANQVDPFDYSVVSPLVDEIIEHGKGKAELIKLGYKPELVDNIMQRIRKAEYKRRQAAPGIKITKKAFGIGRKMPIVNKYVSNSN